MGQAEDAVKTWTRALVIGAAVFLAAAVGIAMLQLPDAPVRLPDLVGATLAQSGVTHAVTAVLLNFRGYDTLLEIAVLLLALIGVLAVGGDQPKVARPIAGSAQPLLQSLARRVVPVMILIAGYLLWAGERQPGGAFQAGAVLAAAGVLLYLSNIRAAWQEPRWPLRFGLAAGFLAFLLIAALLLAQGALLQFPPARAGMLILLIESALTVSLGLILTALFLWQPNENEEDA